MHLSTQILSWYTKEAVKLIIKLQEKSKLFDGSINTAYLFKCWKQVMPKSGEMAVETACT